MRRLLIFGGGGLAALIVLIVVIAIIVSAVGGGGSQTASNSSSSGSDSNSSSQNSSRSQETTVQQDFMDPYPTWLQDAPEADIPIPGLEGRLIDSPHGQVVFFHALEDVEIPPHSHAGQWGIVVAGRVHLTVDDEATTYEPGEYYEIPSGAEHSVRIEAGTRVIDVFQDPDRYRPKEP